MEFTIIRSQIAVVWSEPMIFDSYVYVIFITGANIIMQPYEELYRLPVTIEGYMLNDLEMPFNCKALVIAGFIIFVFLIFGQNYVKKMKILPQYQPRKCLSMMLV